MSLRIWQENKCAKVADYLPVEPIEPLRPEIPTGGAEEPIRLSSKGFFPKNKKIQKNI